MCDCDDCDCDCGDFWTCCCDWCKGFGEHGRGIASFGGMLGAPKKNMTETKTEQPSYRI